MNDDQRLLAHAALDGELTDEDAARAAADPEVAGEIERLRGARDALAAVDPLPGDRRAALLATALDAFDADRRSGDADSRPSRRAVVAPPPASLDARRRFRWLAPVAAAALVGVVAVGVIIGSGGGSSDEAGDGADSADATMADTAGGAERIDETMIATDGVPEGTGADLTAADTMDADQPVSSEAVPLVRNPEELAQFASVAVTTAGAPATTAATAATEMAPDTTFAGPDDGGGGPPRHRLPPVPSPAPPTSARSPTAPTSPPP